MSWLAENCPRLARARDQHVAAVRELRHRECLWLGEVSRLEQLVAHREMQLVRQLRNRSAAYVAERRRKLEEAQRVLERVRRRRPTAA